MTLTLASILGLSAAIGICFGLMVASVLIEIISGVYNYISESISEIYFWLTRKK